MQRIISRSLFLCILIMLTSGIAFSYSWNISTIDFLESPDCNTFLSIDDNGQMSVAYQGTLERLKGADFDGNSWSIGFPNELYFNWDDVMRSSASRNLVYAVDGKISVVDGVLKYIYKNGSYWAVDVVDSASIVGDFPSLEYDLNGNPNISYYDKYSGELKYAKGSLELASIQSLSTMAKAPVITPTLTLTASAKSIKEGQSVTLTWDSTNATYVYKSNFNSFTIYGSVTLQPLKTTTYSMTVSNTKKLVTKSVTVKVLPLIPTVKLIVSPSTIILGENVAMMWYSTDADSVYKSNFGAGIGDIDGAILLTPTKSVSNQLIVTNTYKRKSKTATAKITVKKTGSILPDLTPPLITKPKVQNPISFIGMNAGITAYAADANGIGSVSVKITAPNGVVEIIQMSNIGSKYSFKHNLSPNLSNKPVTYILEVRALDTIGNQSLPEIVYLEVPAADVPPGGPS